MPTKSFPSKTISEISKTKYFYLRAGADHKFIPVWDVVVDGRVLVRPWNDKAKGWYRTFLADGNGAVKVDEKEVPVRAVPVKTKALLDAMDAAYAAKYTTKANRPYVTGFATPKRRATTLELIPA